MSRIYAGDFMKKWINKQTIIAFVLGAFLFSGSVGAATLYQFMATNDSLFVDGKQAKKPMYKYDGTNYVPLRAAAEILGVDVKYANNRADLISPKTDLETVVKNCKDSCVMIYAYKDGKMAGQGSGFVYNGYVVTAKHVTDLGDKYDIFIDDSLYGVTVTSTVKLNTTLDVSVIDAKLTQPSVKLGNSDKLTEGEKLVSITSPKGVQNTIDECVNSGFAYVDTGTYLTISESNMTYGSSGGGIFDYSSRLIAMTKSGDGGGNLAIPINDLKPTLEKLK